MEKAVPFEVSAVSRLCAAAGAAAPGSTAGMHRKLHRLNITPDFHARLARNKILTANDLLSKHEHELMRSLDVSEPQARHLIQLTSELCCPPMRKASAILASKTCMPTTLHILDDVLRGGLALDTITEVVGPPGVGKTQFCHTMAVVALTVADAAGQARLCEQGAVIYIDTEGTFSAARLVEIAAARFPSAYGTAEQKEALASRVAVIPVHSAADLEKRVDSLEEAIIDLKARLIILDSIASVARLDFDNDNTAARQALLIRLASTLKAVAERYLAPVLVSNQVTNTTRRTPVAVPHGGHSTQTPSQHAQPPNASGAASREGYMTPALGVLWSHSVNTRLALDFGHLGTTKEQRRMTLAKSATAPVIAMAYVVEAGGTRLTDEAVEVEGNHWDETLSKRTEAAPGMLMASHAW